MAYFVGLPETHTYTMWLTHTHTHTLASTKHFHVQRVCLRNAALCVFTCVAAVVAVVVVVIAVSLVNVVVAGVVRCLLLLLSLLLLRLLGHCFCTQYLCYGYKVSHTQSRRTCGKLCCRCHVCRFPFPPVVPRPPLVVFPAQFDGGSAAFGLKDPHAAKSFAISQANRLLIG